MGDYLLPLNESVSVTLDGNGNGTVRLGPSNASQQWVPSNAACSVTSNVSEPIFVLYNGSASNANRIGGTYTGSNDNTDVSGVTLYPGSVFTGVWTNGDPGATATLSLQGAVNRNP
jgi:hypothetical protein